MEQPEGQPLLFNNDFTCTKTCVCKKCNLIQPDRGQTACLHNGCSPFERKQYESITWRPLSIVNHNQLSVPVCG